MGESMRETNTSTLGDGKVFTYFTKNHCWVNAFEGGSGWEPNNLRYAKKLAGEPDIILDIGANIGQESVYYSDWARSVLAFEPIPVIYEVLCRNILDNSARNVKTYNLGCGSERAFLNMRFQESNEGSSYICETPGRNNVQVEVVRLDDFLQDLEGKISFVKIDVEGFEMEVLKGMKNLIVNHRPSFQIEAIDSQLARAGTSSLDIWDFFSALGYEASIHTGKTIARSEAPREKRSRADLFFTPSKDGLLEMFEVKDG